MAHAGDDDREQIEGLSRRELLKRVGLVAVVLPAGLRAPGVAHPLVFRRAQTAAATPLTFEHLTAAESEALEAVVARLIPTDEHGPGATEARAALYIDGALGGPLAASREAYRAGLAAVNAYAQSSKGAPFSRLSAAAQDAVLRDMETNVATGFAPSAAAFFALLRTHTIQGTFCDPYYGGNANFVGWDLIGYPGLLLTVTAAQQQLDARSTPTRRSAYDHAQFSKKKPTEAEAGAHHGN